MPAPRDAAPADGDDNSSRRAPEAADAAEEGPPVDLGEIQAAWKQSILPTVSERSIPTGSVLAEAKPVALDGDRLVLEFPPAASFHRGLAEEPKNAGVLAAVLHEVTGRRPRRRVRARRRRPAEEAEAEDEPATEEEIIALVQTTFDTRKLGKEGD